MAVRKREEAAAIMAAGWNVPPIAVCLTAQGGFSILTPSTNTPILVWQAAIVALDTERHFMVWPDA